MISALFTGVSGLKSHQVQLDVIGNNIANVNTIGFKSGRAIFKDIFNQTLKSASSSSELAGGVNPQQIGNGVSLGAIDNIFTQGSLEFTNNASDLAIQGAGFFVLSDGNTRSYTRTGTFEINRNGYLVDPASGLMVQGKMATNGKLSEGTIDNLRLPFGQKLPASATTNVVLESNIDARTAEGASGYTTTFDVYDSLGNSHPVSVSFTKAGENQWTWNAAVNGTAVGNGNIAFNPDGSLQSADGNPLSFNPQNGAEAMTITLDFGAPNTTNGLSQLASASTVTAKNQNGYGMGVLEGFNFDESGTIRGVFSNGVSQVLGQVALAHFNNPGGLTKAGSSLYQESGNSGQAILGRPGVGGLGSIAPGALEMSNVDLTTEFTKMILAQRGFQANARVISTTDAILGELVTLRS